MMLLTVFIATGPSVVSTASRGWLSSSDKLRSRSSRYFLRLVFRAERRFWWEKFENWVQAMQAKYLDIRKIIPKPEWLPKSYYYPWCEHVQDFFLTWQIYNLTCQAVKSMPFTTIRRLFWNCSQCSLGHQVLLVKHKL